MRTQTRLWLGRLGWMAALWAAGVGILGIVAVVLHFAMRAAGMR